MTTERPQDWKTDSAVVSWSEALTHLGHPTKHAYTLHLADGSEVTGCAYCPLVFTTVAGVISRHTPTRHREHTAAGQAGIPSGFDVRTELRNLPLHKVIDLAATAMKRGTKSDDSEWRGRAVKAEGELSRLRKIINGPSS